MAIEFECKGCEKTLRVPDHAAGMTVTCPECQTRVRVPEGAYEAEPAVPARVGAEAGEEARRPCPMCGEMIMAGALKCRYCGEVFDEDLRRAGKHRGRPLASRGARLVAALLDGFIMLIVAAPGFFLMIAAANERDRRSIVLAVTILLAGLAVVGVIQWVLLSTRGQTIGKIALGVRIVRYSDGGEVGFVTAVLLRSIVPGLIGAVPYVGGLFGLVDILFIFGEERRCIHDLIAGTMVVEA